MKRLRRSIRGHQRYPAYKHIRASKPFYGKNGGEADSSSQPLQSVISRRVAVFHVIQMLRAVEQKVAA